jgi:hypothetical protein
MPKSRNKRKNGSTKDGTYKKHSKSDIRRINTSYQDKLEEYGAMSLEALEALGENKKLGGGYKMAYIQVLMQKRIKDGRD